MKNRIQFYLPGILMIAISLLIVAVPEILVVFAASVLFLFGIAALRLGHMIRKQKVKTIRLQNIDSETDFFEVHFERIPVFRMW